MSKSQNAVPAGFRLDSDETTANGITYPVEFLQAESLDAIVEYYVSEGNSPTEAANIVRDVWNAHNKQGATQSPKSAIRKALEAGESTEEAIEKAQETTREFVTGAPRQRAGGVTKKEAGNMGVEIAQARAAKGSDLTKAELDEIIAKYMG